MKKASPSSESYLDRIRFWSSSSKANGTSQFSLNTSRPPILPLSVAQPITTKTQLPTQNNSRQLTRHVSNSVPLFPSTDVNVVYNARSSKTTANNVADNTSVDHPPPAPPPEADGQGGIIAESEKVVEKKNVVIRFGRVAKFILLSSYVNLLLIFVPVGIAVKAAALSPGIIFAMNAIAIVPLAGLLSHATESVAKRMGDTVGALMNITFGNAVELIIFIALQKNEINIVQSALLGSILANLLLILGMSFLIGGLRFREQIYNSSVTNMSACLLSLSVMSLLLPTAFHASFSDSEQELGAATKAVLKVSRGTSVILLIVYGMYLLFQLKSHAYMYESTPQHIIDEESAPGPVANWLDSSDSDSDSSSSSDSDGSNESNTTAKKIKRAVMRGGRRRRKSSAGSKEAADVDTVRTRTSSLGTNSSSPKYTDTFTDDHPPLFTSPGSHLGPADAIENDDNEKRGDRSYKGSVRGRHRKERKKERKRREKRERRAQRMEQAAPISEVVVQDHPEVEVEIPGSEPRRVDFALTDPSVPSESDARGRLPFLRGMRPQMPKTLSQNVFSSSPAPPQLTGSIPRIRYGIRRTNSLPDRLNQTYRDPVGAPAAGGPPILLNRTTMTSTAVPHDDENISRTAAVILLLISTGLVAVCAEFMVDSINAVVSGNSGISEMFIGLIILPIVGNASEHVTSVTVATKNKMDLAIGVAVGSSIQIALFVTPFIVLLGWAMSREMSLYFTLFETVSLFVAVFVVNFLVLDGRSNYLEGALLCAAYVIVAVAAFFYPAVANQSLLGGNPDATSKF